MKVVKADVDIFLQAGFWVAEFGWVTTAGSVSRSAWESQWL